MESVTISSTSTFLYPAGDNGTFLLCFVNGILTKCICKACWWDAGKGWDSFLVPWCASGLAALVHRDQQWTAALWEIAPCSTPGGSFPKSFPSIAHQQNSLLSNTSQTQHLQWGPHLSSGEYRFLQICSFLESLPKALEGAVAVPLLAILTFLVDNPLQQLTILYNKLLLFKWLCGFGLLDINW